MFNKHEEVREEAYSLLNKMVGASMSPAIINKLIEIRNSLNSKYKGLYHVEFVPLTEVIDRFVVNVKVHTVH